MTGFAVKVLFDNAGGGSDGRQRAEDGPPRELGKLNPGGTAFRANDGLAERTVGSIPFLDLSTGSLVLFLGNDDLHMGARMEVEKLPLLLSGIVAHFGVKIRGAQPRRQRLGGSKFVERNQSHDLSHMQMSSSR